MKEQRLQSKTALEQRVHNANTKKAEGTPGPRENSNMPNLILADNNSVASNNSLLGYKTIDNKKVINRGNVQYPVIISQDEDDAPANWAQS